MDKCWVINGEKEAINSCETSGVNPFQIQRRHNLRRHLSVRRRVRFIRFVEIDSFLSIKLLGWSDSWLNLPSRQPQILGNPARSLTVTPQINSQN